ncbi:DUF501 domain-containing protein [Seongchinamella sediminis]|uniref:DUF501 domain-containing protein n=1 Tax=Seongchinamella sediminis TaxID=2283635 RepID=A0A3L7E263_9GAMM|nr:DUF501 domain-containing protein [Seongchinamella sediminis]RLQ22810.1 DUF501 domain-containing protein [Seongchinamella sediminis]
MAVSDAQRAHVAKLLGREPRGLRDIAVSDSRGRPMVIRVASLVDRKPFPTLFWLVDRALNYRIDQEEAGGLIARLQADINASTALRSSMAADHARYIALRDSFISAQERAAIDQLGFAEVFRQKGIGGIADRSRIRCLHTWYAAHLVSPNTVGELLDQHWRGAAGADCVSGC